MSCGSIGTYLDKACAARQTAGTASTVFAPRRCPACGRLQAAAASHSVQPTQGTADSDMSRPGKLPMTLAAGGAASSCSHCNATLAATPAATRAGTCVSSGTSAQHAASLHTAAASADVAQRHDRCIEPQCVAHEDPALSDTSTSDPDHWLVPDAMLDKAAHCIDIVTRECRDANCFTKAYGRYAKGAGSVLATKNLHVLASFGDWGHREEVCTAADSEYPMICFGHCALGCVAQ